jgi:hypothetical protein
MTDKRVEQMSAVHKEALELFTKKNTDYGDAFANYGPVGVIVRMGDKIQRLHSVSTNGVTLINSESLRDTLIDLHNYSAMAIMLLDEEKEKETKKRNEYLGRNIAEPKNCVLKDIHRF